MTTEYLNQSVKIVSIFDIILRYDEKKIQSGEMTTVTILNSKNEKIGYIRCKKIMSKHNKKCIWITNLDFNTKELRRKYYKSIFLAEIVKMLRIECNIIYYRTDNIKQLKQWLLVPNISIVGRSKLKTIFFNPIKQQEILELRKTYQC